MELLLLVAIAALVFVGYKYFKYEPPSSDWEESSCEKARREMEE